MHSTNFQIVRSNWNQSWLNGFPVFRDSVDENILFFSLPKIAENDSEPMQPPIGRGSLGASSFCAIAVIRFGFRCQGRVHLLNPSTRPHLRFLASRRRFQCDPSQMCEKRIKIALFPLRCRLKDTWLTCRGFRRLARCDFIHKRRWVWRNAQEVVEEARRATNTCKSRRCETLELWIRWSIKAAESSFESNGISCDVCIEIGKGEANPRESRRLCECKSQDRIGHKQRPRSLSARPLPGPSSVNSAIGLQTLAPTHALMTHFLFP